MRRKVGRRNDDRNIFRVIFPESERKEGVHQGLLDFKDTVADRSTGDLQDAA
jgi:hypothetical protein